MSNPTVAIPQERVSELQAAINKLNKRADKIGCPPISLELGQVFDKLVAPGQRTDYVPVTINGEAPRLNGWIFVATLEHDESGTLIRRLPVFDNEIDLSQYRKATPDNCDHCGYKRRRNDTYIVAHPLKGDRYFKDGFETKQVGSSCLKDFIGHENPEAIARHMQNVRDFIEDVQGGSYAGGRITPRYDLRTFMAVAHAEIEEHGYVTRKQAQDQLKLATSDAVRTRWHRFLNDEFERAQINSAYYQEADNTLQWVRGLEEDDLTNDYLWNLYTICKGESLAESQFGYAASAPAARANMERDHRPSDDGDRHKAEVTHYNETPTQPQKDYIYKLAQELETTVKIPATRIEASELINELKVRKERSKASEAQHQTGEEKASSKQLSYINGLMDKKVIPDKTRKEARAKIDAGLTRSAASKAIEWLQGFEEAS